MHAKFNKRISLSFVDSNQSPGSMTTSAKTPHTEVKSAIDNLLAPKIMDTTWKALTR